MTGKSTKEPRPPAGLGKRGRTFWRQIATDFELSDAESHLLVEACRVLDRLDVLDGLVAADGAMVTGSQGQQVLNPAFAEARQQAVVLHRLLSALDLPDDGEGTGSVVAAVSSNARRAADARWSAYRKAGG